MHKIVCNKKINKYRLITLTPGDQIWCLAAAVSAATYSDEVKATITATTINNTVPGTRTAPKRVVYISVIYNKFLYAYMPHTYATVNWDITISY